MGKGGAYGEVPGEQEKPLKLPSKWGPSQGHGLLEGEELSRPLLSFDEMGDNKTT